MRNQLLGNRYRLLGMIGEGGMASVYRASDTKLDRKVAVKVLHPHLSQNSDIRQRFQQEARALSGIDHPNIIKIYDFSGVDSEQLWIVTEILRGATLTDYVKSFPHSSLHPIVAAIIVQEVCRALDCAHAQSITHRDVKPDNIMVLADGRIKLMDFGIAKDARTHSMTMTGTFMGSPSYMSPEQVRGRDIDHRSDIYSLAVLFYEIVTGVLPYSGASTAEVINKIMVGKFIEPAAISGAIPHEVNAMIVRGMAGDPHRRYQSVSEWQQDLTRFLASYGFMESHIELERYFRDRAGFEARLHRVQFARPKPATTVPGDQPRPAQDSLLATTQVLAPASRPYPPRQPARAPEPRVVKQTGYAPNRRVGRVSRRETQSFNTGPSRGMRFMGMAVVGVLIGVILAGAFELVDRIAAVKEPAKVATTPVTPAPASVPTLPPQPLPDETPATPEATATDLPAAGATRPSGVAANPTPTKKASPRRERTDSEATKTPARPERRPAANVAIRRMVEPVPVSESPNGTPAAAPVAPSGTSPSESGKPRSAAAQLLVNAQPAAEIFINGKQQGTTNDPEIRLRGLKLPAGRHQLELKRRGYATATRSLTLEAGDTKTLNIKLEKDQRSVVRFTIQSNAAPARVTIEETGGSLRRELEIASESVSVNLPAAVYKVRVEYGTQSIERSVTIGGGRDALTFHAEFRKEE